MLSEEKYARLVRDLENLSKRYRDWSADGSYSEEARRFFLGKHEAYSHVLFMLEQAEK